MPFDVYPATPDRWPDLEAVFMAKGCSVARNCWCMYYRLSGKQPPRGDDETFAGRNRNALREIVWSGDPPGLIGYEDGVPVGWIAIGPRENYARLEKSPVMKAVDEQRVWSVIRFVVPSENRRRGVAKALLDGARVRAVAGRNDAGGVSGRSGNRSTRPVLMVRNKDHV